LVWRGGSPERDGARQGHEEKSALAGGGLPGFGGKEAFVQKGQLVGAQAFNYLQRLSLIGTFARQ
jgi:hypothetical protein